MKLASILDGVHRRAMALAGLCLVALTPLAACADSVVVTVSDPNLIHYYPNAQDPAMPAYYKAKTGFPQTLQQSIQQFTQASLQRDGLKADVSVAMAGTTAATITMTSSDPAVVKTLAGYGPMLTGFIGNAGLGWAGATGCQNKAGCWDPASATSASPWAFYLPLGLPLVNQKAVMLLNYPPSDALCSADYLSNFTMARWSGVLQRIGISDPVLYETIVDVHPIAAPGSGQSGYIANTTGFFSPGYDQPMVNLLLTPPGSSTQVTQPLQVAGSDALASWATITGMGTVTPGAVGTYTPPKGPSIPWVATNHPDVTTYQSCPGDTSKSDKKADATPVKYSDNNLVADELMDLRAACALRLIAASPGQVKPQDALNQCAKIWCTDNNGICQRKAVCIQARLDYNYTSPGNCKCEAAAAAFCAANDNNACPSPTSVTSCEAYNAQYCGNPPQSYSTCKSLTPPG